MPQRCGLEQLVMPLAQTPTDWEGPLFLCRAHVLGSVSSFAYQGTNSHAVLAAAGDFYAKSVQQHAWERKQLWFQMNCHPLLMQFGYEGTARVQCNLQRPALSYLSDYTVNGQPLAPPTLFLEMAAAAGQLCTSWQAVPITLLAVTIGIPLHLNASSFATTVLSVVLDHVAGKLTNQQQSTPRMSAAHLQAQLQCIHGRQIGQSCSYAGRQRNLPICAASAISTFDQAFGVACGTPYEDSGYLVHPAISDACLQLQAALRQLIGNTESTSLTAVGLFASGYCNRATNACATTCSDARINHWQDKGNSLVMQELQTQAQRILSVAGTPVESLSASKATHDIHSDAEQPCLNDVASLRHSVLTSLIKIASLLLGDDIMPDQPLMEGGLDSIGESCSSCAS